MSSRVATVELFLQYVKHVLLKFFRDAGGYTEPLSIAVSKCGGLWLRWFHVVDMDTIMAVYSSIHVVSVGTSSTWLAHAGLRVRAVARIGAGDTAGYYYGSIVYMDLGLLAKELKR